MEVGEVEAQTVAGGRGQGPAPLLVVGVLPGEARGHQAPKHGRRPLWARGCGGRAPQQAQEDQQPDGSSRGVREGPGLTPRPCWGDRGGLPLTSL